MNNTPRYLKQELSPNPERTDHPFAVKKHGLGLDSHPICFTLSCKLPQWMLKVLARGWQQDKII